MNAPQPLEVVIIGTAAMDLVARVEHLPGPDELVVASSHGLYPGGSGANVAVGLARLGCRTGFWGTLGTGADAQMLVKSFADDNIDISACPSVGLPQVRCLITVDRHGARTIIVLPGAGRIEQTEELDLDYICQGRAVFLTDYAADIGLAVLQAARRAGTITCYSPGGAAVSQGLAPILPLLPWVDVLLISRAESELLMQDRRVESAASRFVDGGAEIVIVTLGAEGALLSRRGSHYRIPARRDLPVVDTTGAGDAFAAGLLCGALEGKSWEEATNFAIAVAALSLGQVGARTGLPFRGEVEQYLAHSELP